MDTTANSTRISEKQAGAAWTKLLGPLAALPKETLMTYLTAVAAVGAAGGATLGAVSSHVKSKNPKIVALNRKKEFYDRKVDEMTNENWLNDVMTLRKKLESSKLSDDERTALEKEYIKLLDSQK